jgi:hypothetical protein
MSNAKGNPNNEARVIRHSMQHLHVPERVDSRHIQIQRMAAMISAIQLTVIGIVWVPKVTCA